MCERILDGTWPGDPVEPVVHWNSIYKKAIKQNTIFHIIYSSFNRHLDTFIPENNKPQYILFLLSKTQKTFSCNHNTKKNPQIGGAGTHIFGFLLEKWLNCLKVPLLYNESATVHNGVLFAAELRYTF